VPQERPASANVAIISTHTNRPALASAMADGGDAMLFTHILDYVALGVFIACMVAAVIIWRGGR